MPIPGSVLSNLLPFGLAGVDSLYPSRATLRPLSVTLDTTGQELHVFADSVVAGQYDLHCRTSPPTLIRPRNDEIHQSTIERFIDDIQVNFQSYINIAPELLSTWQVRIDGKVYQIRGVENDGSGITTRMLVSIMIPTVA